MDKWLSEGYKLSGTAVAGTYLARRKARYGVLVTRWDGVLILADDTFYWTEAEALEAIESLAVA